MRRCETYRIQEGVVETIEPAAVGDHLRQPDELLWVDLQHPTKDDFAWLAETFHFHPLAMEDARNQRQRAKVDWYDGFFFFVLPVVHFHPRSHRIDSHEIHLFVGPNYIVSLRQLTLAPMDLAHHRWKEARPHQEPNAFLFYQLLDAVVDGYFPVVDEIGEKIDEIDTTLFSAPDKKALQEIFALRRSLLGIRKTLGPLRDALNEVIQLRGESGYFTLEHTRAYYIDVFDHVLRVTDFVDTYRDMLSGSLEAYQSSLANTLNVNMQRLTVAATILATATVVTGFFGMNLQGMMINSPWPYGGHLILGILLVLTAVELWFFKRIGWL